MFTERLPNNLVLFNENTHYTRSSLNIAESYDFYRQFEL